jgi:Tfp pilus assembly protein PilP
LKNGKVNDSAKGTIVGIDKGSIVGTEDNPLHKNETMKPTTSNKNDLSKLANLSLKH